MKYKTFILLCLLLGLNSCLVQELKAKGMSYALSSSQIYEKSSTDTLKEVAPKIIPFLPETSFDHSKRAEIDSVMSYSGYYEIFGDFIIEKIKKHRNYIIVIASRSDGQYLFITDDKNVRKNLKVGSTFHLKGHGLFDLNSCLTWGSTKPQKVAWSYCEDIDLSKLCYLDEIIE